MTEPSGDPDGRRFASFAVEAIRRVPFTALVVLVAIVFGCVTGAFWHRVGDRGWFGDIAFGVPSLEAHKWWTPLTGWFFGTSPAEYILVVLVFALAVGWAEWRLGTVRTAFVAVVGQLAGELGAVALVQLMRHTNWEWAQALAQTRDVGATAAIVATLAAASATVRSPWRLRLRAVLSAFVAISFLFEGTLADVQHLLALAIFLPLGERYFSTGEHGVMPRTRREIRMLAFLGALLTAAVAVAVFFFPGDGPLGPTEAQDTSLLSLIVDVLLVAVVANGLRLGKRWAWWIAVIFGSLTVLATIVVVLAVIVTVDVRGYSAVTAGSALLWSVELALLFGGRYAFRVPFRRRIRGGALDGVDPPAAARELLQRNGGSTMSWMITWEGNSYFFADDGESVIGYQKHAGTVVALADPVTPPNGMEQAVAEFTAKVESAGLTPCLFSVTGRAAVAATGLGWRALQIAEDTIVDLPALEFKGKPWQAVRSAMNRAAKEGIQFRLVTLSDEPFSVLAQVRAISEEWVGDKGLPEMGFTLGTVEEALDPQVRVGLAVDTAGNVHGVTSWLPVFAPGGDVRGWTLDVMRRRSDGFKPVMEFLIGSAAMAFKDLHAEFISLSGAPLARSDEAADDAASMDRVLESLGAALEPFYGFRSLHTFKKKFNPRYEPVFICFRDEADLPRIGIALTRAFLPNATTPQLLRLAASRG